MALTKVGYTNEITDVTHFPSTPANETAAREQFQEMFDDMLGIHNDSLDEIDAAMAALVLEALGLSAGSINNVAFMTDGLITNDKLATDIKIGSLAALTTTAKTSVQAAINELVTKAGTLTSLSTTEKTNLVGAINELYSRLVTTAMITDAAVTLAKLGTDVPRILNGGTVDTPTQSPEDYPAGTLYGWYTV